jgi:tetratricopeptide (TPR) repeat protein
MTELRCEPLSIPGAPLGEENPLPFFRDPSQNRLIRAHDSIPLNKRTYLGWQTAFRVLPYRMQDQYSRQLHPLTFRSIILENEFLKATFLPELGGRLISLVYKPQERELLHRNPVFQPADLAIRNAWFSGGIEWNIGQYGHTFTTCSPLFAAAIQGNHGEPGLRMYEFERCKGLFWQLDFYLPPNFPFLIVYTRVVNPNHQPVSMYWWTNVAVNEKPGVRILAPANQAIFHSVEKEGPSFGLTELPYLPSLNGKDGTYSLNSHFANEFFFQCDDASLPWEAALDQQGSGFIEASTKRIMYRKLFCWGTHSGGRHWQEFLAQPGEAYQEIQAGLAPTQVHGLPMPENTTWEWTQIFGYLEADPALVHSMDWQTAYQEVEKCLLKKLEKFTPLALEETYKIIANHPSQVILQSGSGWGALEMRRRINTKDFSDQLSGFYFPPSSMGNEQAKWATLQSEGYLPEQDPKVMPGEWMVQREWKQLLESTPNHNWYSLLHLGVMHLEHFEEEKAIAAWEASIHLQPSAWAYRNLAVLYLRRKDKDRALAYYQDAWKIVVQDNKITVSLAVEYIQMLVEVKQYQDALTVYQSLPSKLQAIDRIQILRGRIALAFNDLESLSEVLEGEYAILREGETVLSDLWFELQARLEANRLNVTVDETLRQKVKKQNPPPARLDFRSHNPEES